MTPRLFSRGLYVGLAFSQELSAPLPIALVVPSQVVFSLNMRLAVYFQPGSAYIAASRI